ncbi:hypothetical protein NFHSH190041_28300 [Shewanella sp. NFH-SH190041]|uniref:peptidase inhibitor family I36 protein n=1 Tax=Shewanella sp. NFH-SH190041 TaxID=2950245 RepID=UPI0021C3A28D|nr:peptidase inhibitor family I36 protein [Shewanella sp. NFH-SH190041]BDM65378.1 hypothetical protein NFHSH190041_28300 [Shewanella sp. NFH-SH190041]
MRLNYLVIVLFFCICGTANAVVYNKITSARDCVYPEYYVPVKDVQDNMSFFRNNMGRWQISQIADRHVIMGSGYRFQVKRGTAGNAFCVSDGVIKTQREMDRLVADSAYFISLLKKYRPLYIVTSDGNGIPDLNLPQLGTTDNGIKIKIIRRAFDSTKVHFAVNHTTPFITIPQNKQLEFEFDGTQWNPTPSRVIKRQNQLNSIKNDNNLRDALKSAGVLKVETSDGNWLSKLNLKTDDVDDGTMLIFYRNSTWAVSVNYSGKTISPKRGETVKLIKLSGSWRLLGEAFEPIQQLGQVCLYQGLNQTGHKLCWDLREGNGVSSITASFMNDRSRSFSISADIDSVAFCQHFNFQGWCVTHSESGNFSSQHQMQVSSLRVGDEIPNNNDCRNADIKICFYEHANQRGRRYCINKPSGFDNVNLWDVGDRSRNTFSSASITPAFGVVRVCKDVGYAGGCRDLNQTDLNFIGGGFNDRTQSVRFNCTGFN